MLFIYYTRRYEYMVWLLYILVLCGLHWLYLVGMRLLLFVHFFRFNLACDLLFSPAAAVRTWNLPPLRIWNSNNFGASSRQIWPGVQTLVIKCSGSDLFLRKFSPVPMSELSDYFVSHFFSSDWLANRNQIFINDAEIKKAGEDEKY